MHLFDCVQSATDQKTDFNSAERVNTVYRSLSDQCIGAMPIHTLLSRRPHVMSGYQLSC